MKLLCGIILILGIIINVYGQNNLVKNGDFENCYRCDDNKLSYLSESNLLEWKNPTDLRIMFINLKLQKAERDAQGFSIVEKKANSGKGFVRLVFDNKLDSCLTNKFYSFREKRYIQSKLESKLIRGKFYCFSVNLRTLGSISKIREIGIALSSKEIGIQKRRYINYDCEINLPYLENLGYRWQKYCKVYKAKGNERYITLGQFLSNNKFKSFSNDDPFMNYDLDNSIDIDDVSIVEMSDKINCDCNTPTVNNNTHDSILGIRLIEYGVHADYDGFSSSKNIDVIKIGCLFIEGEDNIFDSLPPNDFSLAYIDYFIKYMLTVNNFQLEIIASTSKEEEGQDLLDLSKKRAKFIYDRFVSFGIDEKRLSYSGVIDTDISQRINDYVRCKGEIRLVLNIIK